MEAQPVINVSCPMLSAHCVLDIQLCSPLWAMAFKYIMWNNFWIFFFFSIKNFDMKERMISHCWRGANNGEQDSQKKPNKNLPFNQIILGLQVSGIKAALHFFPPSVSKIHKPNEGSHVSDWGLCGYLYTYLHESLPGNHISHGCSVTAEPSAGSRLSRLLSVCVLKASSPLFILIHQVLGEVLKYFHSLNKRHSTVAG